MLYNTIKLLDTLHYLHRVHNVITVLPFSGLNTHGGFLLEFDTILPIKPQHSTVRFIYTLTTESFVSKSLAVCRKKQFNIMNLLYNTYEKMDFKNYRLSCEPEYAML